MAPTGWRLAAPVVLAVSGMMFALSARASDGEDLRGGRYTELTDLVRAEEQRASELTERLESLQREVETLAAAEAQTDGGSPNAVDWAEQLRPIAGLSAVTGPGIAVSLDDAALPAEGRAMPSGTTYDDYVVHQQDVEGVVNALWAGGAEAMTVMDQRVVSTSAVRCVGNVLILHGRVYSPPFTISAIGDVEGMNQALDDSEAVASYRSWADYIGLGYQVTTSDELTMPAYDGPLSYQVTTADELPADYGSLDVTSVEPP